MFFLDKQEQAQEQAQQSEVIWKKEDKRQRRWQSQRQRLIKKKT